MWKALKKRGVNEDEMVERIAHTLKISKETKPDTFENAIDELRGKLRFLEKKQED